MPKNQTGLKGKTEMRTFTAPFKETLETIKLRLLS